MRSPKSRIYSDDRIVRYIEENRINVNGIYEDIERKKEFVLDVLGYTRLRTGKDQFVFLDECKPARISAVVKKAYDNAKKRLEKAVLFNY